MALYVCEFCQKVYKREVSFLAHECEEMRRVAYSRTATGQSAFHLYNAWMVRKGNGRRDIGTFMQSSKFNAFIKFASMVIKLKGLADADIFMDVMIRGNFDPSSWTNEKVFAVYIEHLNTKLSPIDKFQIAVNTLQNIADTYNCELSDVFNYIPVPLLLTMLFQHKLTPWLLLCSGKFMDYVHGCNDEERRLIDNAISSSIWSVAFKDNAKDVSIIKHVIAELSI